MLANELDRLDIPARVLAALSQQVRWKESDTTSGINAVQTEFARPQWLDKTITQPATGEVGILQEMLQSARALKDRGWFLDNLKNDLFECNEAPAI